MRKNIRKGKYTMTRQQYHNQRKVARTLARQDAPTDPGRKQYAAAIIRVVEQFNGRITAYHGRTS
jgi:hypothetical protein